MSFKEQANKPRNYLIAGALLALGSLAMCEEKPEGRPLSRKPAAVKRVRQLEGPRQEAHEDIRKVLESWVSDDGPEVTFKGGDFIYQWEQGLADCLEMEDNTCYLKYDYTAMFRTRLECYSNSWDEFARPVGFTATFQPGRGTAILVHTPQGERMQYEGAPSPVLDLEGSEEFYTRLCRDGLEFLDASAYVNPCEEDPDSHDCLEAELNAEWAASLSDAYEENYGMLAESGFYLEDAGMNLLRVEFETANGGTEMRSFFPKKSFCFEDEEGPGLPCWKFERMFGGEYTGEALLETVDQEQLRIYEE